MSTKSQYHKISTADFEQLIAGFDGERVRVAGTKENVYDIPTDKPGIVVRVFSSITAADNGARDAGRDAIRVLAWSRTADTAVAQATRTHRIGTWADNLRPKIHAMRARINSGEFDGDTPDAILAGLAPAGDDETCVIAADTADTKYGRRIVLTGDTYDLLSRQPGCEDLASELEWDDAHCTFDRNVGEWVIEPSALADLRDVLADAGYALRAPALPDPDAFRVSDVDAEVGQRITVTYDKKNGNGAADKTGDVIAVSDDRITFRRDDGQTMYVSDDGLFTGGHYPFVGTPTGIELAAAEEVSA